MAKELTKLQIALKIQQSMVVINEILHYEKNKYSKEELFIVLVFAQQAESVLKLKKQAKEYGKSKKVDN